MSKHTEGPWEARRGQKDHWVVYGGGEPLADVVHWSAAVDEADARLIAAAPDLLEAAQGLLAFVRARFPDDFVPGGPGFSCEHHRALAAAVTKAEQP